MHEALVDLTATGSEVLAKALAILATRKIKSAIEVVIVSLEHAVRGRKGGKGEEDDEGRQKTEEKRMRE